MLSRGQRLRNLARLRASGRISSLEYLQEKERLSPPASKRRTDPAAAAQAEMSASDRKLREIRARRDRGETSPRRDPARRAEFDPLSGQRPRVAPKSGFLLTEESVTNGEVFTRNVLRFGIAFGIGLALLGLFVR